MDMGADLIYPSWNISKPPKWMTCIGTPYGTSKWQVGDPAQKNGPLNMEIIKGNMCLFQKNLNTWHKFQLTKKDIIWLLCFAWPKSFGHVETNKNVTWEPGWNPPNRACLDDYEIHNASVRLEGRGESAYRKVLETGRELANLDDLNTTNGISGESFSKFLQAQATIQREEETAPLVLHS
jgi:hypothetical protein